jgi:phenylpropionate dioxygenase-like ring-hydroxylating dioxygenase large terminal subunit
MSDKTQHDGTFHQSWYPVALAAEVRPGTLLGQDFLASRVIVYRDGAGKPMVQSAWCPHLGADLSVGEIVDGQIRCPYHHWRFDGTGNCVHIPTGDKIPPGAKIFAHPTAEAWGLIWAFNGEAPLFELPRIPGADECELTFEAVMRGIRPVPPWVGTSNGVDFQHLRTLHNLPTSTPDTIEVRDYAIEYVIETSNYKQHGLITGANVFAQHLHREGMDTFMLFAGAPIDEHRSRAFFVVGVRQAGERPEDRKAVAAKLQHVRGFVEKLLEEDEPILNSIRFRRGVLVASDRHLARFLKYIDEFPKAAACRPLNNAIPKMTAGAR